MPDGPYECTCACHDNFSGISSLGTMTHRVVIAAAHKLIQTFCMIGLPQIL